MDHIQKLWFEYCRTRALADGGNAQEPDWNAAFRNWKEATRELTKDFGFIDGDNYQYVFHDGRIFRTDEPL